MTETQVRRGDIDQIGLPDIEPSFAALAMRGVTLEQFRPVRHTPSPLADEVANIFTRREPPMRVFNRQVAALLGVNYFGPEDWLHHKQVEFPGEVLENMPQFPITPKWLGRKCKLCGKKQASECHAAVFLPGHVLFDGQRHELSLESFQELHDKAKLRSPFVDRTRIALGTTVFVPNGVTTWREGAYPDKVATERISSSRWIIAHLEPVGHQLPYEEQLSLVAHKAYELPTVTEATLLYALLTTRRHSQEHWFPDKEHILRCADIVHPAQSLRCIVRGGVKFSFGGRAAFYQLPDTWKTQTLDVVVHGRMLSPLATLAVIRSVSFA